MNSKDVTRQQSAIIILQQKNRDIEYPPPAVDYWLDADGAYVIDADGVEVQA